MCLGILWTLTAGCSMCGASVAELIAHTGRVDGQKGATDWVGVSNGHMFENGDAIRTTVAASARLTLRGGAHLVLESETIIRFGPVLVFDTGEAVVEGGTDGLRLRTAVGTAVIEPGSVLKIATSEDGQVHLWALVGSAVLEVDGEKKRMGPGDSWAIDIGMAQIESSDAGVEVGAGEGRAGRSANDRMTEPRVETVQNRVPIYENVSPSLWPDLGRRITIHDLQPPTRVGFRMKNCRAGAWLNLRRRGGRLVARSRGPDVVAVPVQAGFFRYEAGCKEDGDRHRADGTIRVLKESGNARLPIRIPETELVADGRKHTVVYQSRLPRLVFEWPLAPVVSKYTLTVDDGSNEKIFDGFASRITVASGRIAEGTHRWWMEAGGRRSQVTRLRIRFDDTTPAAQIRKPEPGARLASGMTDFLGEVLPGAEVSIEGRTIPVDGQHRFSTKVAVPQEGIVTVRVVHPRHGVHYYLRHLER